MQIHEALPLNFASKRVRTTHDAELQAKHAIEAGMSLDDMRAEYQATGIAPNYSGRLSVFVLSAISLGCILCLAYYVEGASLFEWIIVPVTFLYANLAEYVLHRWIMHKPFPGLRKLYVRHALTHHRLYNADAMAIQHHTDLQLILLPWYIIFVYMGMFIAPAAVVVGVIGSLNAALLFAITSIAYYWHYEFLHMLYHVSSESKFHKAFPAWGWIAKHHTVHHELNSMAHFNFNHTYPIFDYLFGTLKR